MIVKTTSKIMTIFFNVIIKIFFNAEITEYRRENISQVGFVNVFFSIVRKVQTCISVLNNIIFIQNNIFEFIALIFNIFRI